MAVVLDEGQRAAALAALPGWTYDPDAAALVRTFRFRDFAEAFGFMTRVFHQAQEMDHHPDWTQRWNRVDVALSTHSAGGVTRRDVALAQAIDALEG